MAIKELTPWAKKPYELIFHAESHFRSGKDYDRGLAIISFDNSIEVSILAFLNLHKYEKDYSEKYKNINNSYKKKLDIFYDEIKKRGLPEDEEIEFVMFYHEQRNNQYHDSNQSVPTQEIIDRIRRAALWVFSILFDFPEIEILLNNDIQKAIPEKILSTIPLSYAIPSKPEILPALTVASLIGAWDEGKEGDMDVMRRIISGF